MSLIETAIRTAKDRAGKPRDAGSEAPVAAAVPEQPAPSLKFEPTRKFRDFPRAETDSRAMESHGVLLCVEDQQALQAYKVLRTRVKQRLKACDWYSMIVAAASSGEGKSLTALNLSIALAQDPNTAVFLVDLDLHRPKLGVYLGLQFDRGLSDYLEGSAELDEIIYSVGVPRLGVIPNAHPIATASESLSSERLQGLVQRLAIDQPRRIVIYDMPPLLEGDDVMKFIPNVDCTLLVVGEGGVYRVALDKALDLIDQEKLVGVVLNRSVERQTGGYY